MQYALMNRIAHDQYNTTNGATPTKHTDVNCWLFADEFAADLGLTEKQVGGLLTTLQEAGLIEMHIDKKKTTKNHTNESSVWFTEEGFQAWKEAAHDAGDAANKVGPKKKVAKKAVVETKKEETVTNNVIDLLAAREGSHKRIAAQTLLKREGKAITMADLAKAVYGEPEFTGQVGMVLKGIAKAIEVQGLALTLTREKGSVTLSSLEPKPAPAKKSRAKKAA
jgi:heme-degrading monooxygenase HmoA